MEKKLGRNDPCWCKSGRKYKVCHEAIDDKIMRFAAQGAIVHQEVLLRLLSRLLRLRKAARLT